MSTYPIPSGKFAVPSFDEVWDNWEYFVESAFSNGALPGFEGDCTPEDIAEAILDFAGLPDAVRVDFQLDLSEVSPEVLAYLQEQYPMWFVPNAPVVIWYDPGESQEPDSGL